MLMTRRSSAIRIWFKRLIPGAGVAVLLGALWVAAPTSAATARPDHVVIAMMENHAYEQIIGSSAAPYVNSLAQQNASFTQSFAIGHPSEPNYHELWSGSNQGVTDDSCPHTFTTGSLGTQLLTAGLSVAGYNESMPNDGFTVCTGSAKCN